MNTSIPSRHHHLFTSEFPNVEFRPVTREWWRELRLRRSEEEIAMLTLAAQVGDVMSSAVAEVAGPGVPERHIFAALSDAALRAGGEIPTMVLAASGSTFSAFDTFQRERPVDRTLEAGDVILTELAPRWPDGSECQTGRSYLIGEPSPEYGRLGEVMMEAYERIAAQFRPGRTDRDVIEAGSVITDAGYSWLSPLVHGAEGGAAGSLPHIASSVPDDSAEATTFEPGMVVCIEVHVGKLDHSAGMFTADTWVVTDDEPRCLNSYPRQVVRV